MPAEIKEFKGAKTISVDPTKQYVAGGFLYTESGGRRTLSGLPEDYTKEHTAKTYKQMVSSDPKLSKAVNFLKISILGEGVQLRPCLSEKDDNYESAEIIADFCTDALKHLDTPLRYTLEQMLDALVYGHKIAEVTYKTTEMSGYTGTFLVPSIIKVKPIDVVQFVVDDKMNVLGFAVRNGNLDKSGKVEVKRGKNGEAAINGKPVLPREKFLVLTIRSEDGDPRGRSILASAFRAWHLKELIWPEYLKYLLLCAIPLLVGHTPENDTGVKEILRNKDGTPVKDPATGGFIEANPVEALRDALLQARNGEVLAVKGGSKVQEIGAQGAGTPFFKAIELFDSQMETGVLLQTLATSEGIHQNRAASTMHMSVLDQLIYWLKGVVVDMLISDLLRPIVRFNFGDDALQFLPKASLGDTERREFATDAAVISDLYKSGYLQPEHLRQTDEILGLEIRDTADPQMLIQQLQTAGIPIVAVPPQPSIAATIQSGTGGGAAAVPISGETPDKEEPAPNLKIRNNVRFPATGRIKGKINKSPKNLESPDGISQLSEEK